MRFRGRKISIMMVVALLLINAISVAKVMGEERVSTPTGQDIYDVVEEPTEIIESDDMVIESKISLIPEIETRSGKVKTEIISGWDFTIVRLADGSWWSWGANEQGQLGLGDTLNRSTPVKINHAELEAGKVKTVLALDRTVAVLMESGDLYNWGMGFYPLGAQPEPVLMAKGISEVGLSWETQHQTNHVSMSMVKGGKVYVAGSGYRGEYGRGQQGYGVAEDGTNKLSRTPSESFDMPVLTSGTLVEIPGTIFKKISSGVELSNVRLVTGSNNSYWHTAVVGDKDIYAWGNVSQLFAKKKANNPITGKITKIRAGRHGNIALTDKKEVWYWFGPEGAISKLPLSNVKDIDIYGDNIGALLEDGSVYMRGDNTYGGVGGANAETFKKVATSVESYSVGPRNLIWSKTDGSIWGFGWNAYNQVAENNDGTRNIFTKVPNLSGMDNIMVSREASYASKGAQFYTWGKGSGGGDLGGERNSPALVKTFDSPINTMKGNATDDWRMFTVTLKNGDHWIIGNHYQGRLGFSPAASYVWRKLNHVRVGNAQKPNTVNGVTYVRPIDEELIVGDFTIVDATQGQYGGSAIDSKGRLLAWGWAEMWGYPTLDRFPQSGGRVEPKATETYVRIPSDKKFTEVASGVGAMYALASDGTVYSRGRSSRNVLGRSGNIYENRQVEGLSDIIQIDLTGLTGIATDKHGDIWSWGANTYGQVGDGSRVDIPRATNITTNIDVKFVKSFIGDTSSYGITDTGDLYAWGNNKYGQLGMGDKFDRLTPRKVDGLPGKVKSVAVGMEHTLILLENGDVYSAGGDARGQLGLGPSKNVLNDTLIPFPDYVDVTTPDNTKFELSGSGTINGKIISTTTGQRLNVTYGVEGASGIIDSGSIGTYTSSVSGVNFSKSIPFSNTKYSLGGHSVLITVENTVSKLKNTVSVNIMLGDTVAPTTPKFSIPDSWVKGSHTMMITPGEDYESGVSQTEWRYTDGDWATYSKPVTLDRYGTVEARTIDNAGNMSKVTTASVKVDNTPPEIAIKYSTKDYTNNDVMIDVSISDKHSGISHMIYEGIRYDNDKYKFIIPQNGNYTIEVFDKVGNNHIEKFSITNIDKTLSFIAPKLIGGPVILSDKGAFLEFEKMKIKDWRYDRTDWRVSLQASRLKNGSVSLPSGTILLGSSAIDTSGAHLIKMVPKYGSYEESIGRLGLLFDLGVTKTDKYTSTLTWDLIQAP